MFTLQSIPLGRSLVKFFFELILFLSRLLLVFDKLVTGGLPLHLLLLEVVCELLLLLQQAHDGAIEQFHDVITKLACHYVRLSFKIIDLSHSEFDIIQCFSQPILILLLAFKHSVDLGFDLV